MNERTTALMVTMPSRQRTAQLVHRVIRRQVDDVFVSLNRFRGENQLPSWLHDVDPRYRVIHPSGSRRANVVWDWLLDDMIDGYVFVVDDDIEYPSDYVGKCLDVLKRYDNKVVVCSHGKNIQKPFRSLQESVSLSHFKFENKTEYRVVIAGVGTTAFHTDVLRPIPADIPFEWFRDLQFATLCARCGVPIYNIARQAGWLKPLPTHDVSLCDITTHDDGLRTFGDEYVKRTLMPNLELL